MVAKSSSNTPLISVVIPVYNVEKTIRACIESVLNQTFDLFEVIFVDDGSSDRSVDIIKEFTDSRMRVITQENRGLAGARNTGIRASKAPFVALLDSDDLWHPEKLERHFKHLCDNPLLGVSYSASQFIDDDGTPMGISQRPKLHDITPQHILCRNPVGNGSAPVIRMLALQDVAFAEEINGQVRTSYFREKLRQSEDIELWTRLALNTNWQFAGLEQELTYYRVNASGLSANLEKQLKSWTIAMEMNYRGNETFFDIHLPLAKAYQKRYLARRAIQSHQGLTAIRLIAEALATDARILTQEPARTAVTSVCAVLALLPGKVYDGFQNLALTLTQPKSA